MIDSLKLHGLFAAPIVPFQNNLEIDEEGFIENIRFLIERSGIDGILCNGLAGEVTSLNRFERKKIVKYAKEVAGNKIVIAGIVANNPTEAIKFAGDAEESGADVLLITAPSIFARGGSDIVEVPYAYFNAISKAIDLPIIVFQHPFESGLHYNYSIINKLAEVKGVIGFKSTVWDQERYEKEYSLLKSLTQKPAVLCGNDSLLLSNFVTGCDGCILGILNVFPDKVGELFYAVKNNKLDKAVKIYNFMLPIIRAIYNPPAFTYYSRMKELLYRIERISSPIIRPPLVSCSPDEIQGIEIAIQQTDFSR